MLVNNAGFSLVKAFENNSVDEETDHLRILARTPMQLTHAVHCRACWRAAHGRIINVSSVSAFIPRGTYGAAKAWLTSFSRFANLRYGPQGVSVTAVCPGFVHTEFHQRMGASMDGVPSWMWLDPERVVREGLAANAAGKSRVHPVQALRHTGCPGPPGAGQDCSRGGQPRKVTTAFMLAGVPPSQHFSGWAHKRQGTAASLRAVGALGDFPARSAAGGLWGLLCAAYKKCRPAGCRQRAVRIRRLHRMDLVKNGLSSHCR